MAGPERWLIDGTLTVVTPLHVGSGETTERPDLRIDSEGVPPDERPHAQISAVAVDHRGRAYLPGRALKGVLRSWLTVSLPPADRALLPALFGSEDIKPLEERGADERFFGGKVEVWNAFLDDSDGSGLPPDPSKIAYWDAGRATGVRAAVALDRVTRTVAPERLFFEEVVPPGVRFRVRLSGQGLSEDEVSLLLFGLSLFGAEHGLALGAGAADGHGRLDWKLRALHRLTEADLAERFARTPLPAGYEGLPELPAAERHRREAAASQRFQAIPRPALRAKLEIAFTSPFLVAAPRRGEKGSGEPDRQPVTDLAGQPLLPASSLRGALRARAERILRTVGLPACRPESKDGACAAIDHAWQAADLCPACRLFGAPGWRALVEVGDFTQAGPQRAHTFRQEHVAIDRFTGSVAGSLKYDTEAFVGARLGGGLWLDLSRRIPARDPRGQDGPAVEPWAVGLLALVLRDLIEGDIPLGGGSAKGFGECTARLLAVSGPRLEGLEGVRELAWRGGEVPAAIAAALAAAVGAFHEKARSEGHPAAASTATAIGEPLPAAKAPPFPVPTSSTPPPGDRFHNPYHFVPLGPALEGAETARAEELAATHEVYRGGDGTYSGRLLFRITTETPTVLGAKREDGGGTDAAVVHPFELEGEPAIPGSTLRGLLSSLAEAATGSALRVLHDASLSYRAQMKDSLPALGRLVDDPAGSGRLKLEPLALPALPCDSNGQVRDVPPLWRELFPTPVLKVYVDGYEKADTGVRLRRGSFLARRRPSSFSADHRDEKWYFPLQALPAWSGGGLTVPNPHVKEIPKRDGRVSWQLVAQDAPPRFPEAREPISAEAYEALTDEQVKAAYVPGLLRVLDLEGHEAEIPTQRKHEVFLPLPQVDGGRTLLEVEEALKAFHRLADERTAAEKDSAHPWPLSLRGKGREKDGKVRLRAGDLVYFQPEDAKTVKALALSSIWRESAGSLYDYVPEDLQPMNPKRELPSIAERLFGYVEQRVEAGRSARALASRVRVSYGRLVHAPEGERYCGVEPRYLHVLGAPKPPAPALYFRNQDGREDRIAKRTLKVNRHEPQGRKMYLHQPSQGEPWFCDEPEEKKRKLHSRVRPLRKGIVFEASLSFDNLTERELALLVYVLRPTQDFRHKLGMGKPLGLGTVRITPLAFLSVDRHRRYAEERDLLAAPRHHRSSLAYPFLEGEVDAAALASLPAELPPGPDLADLRDRLRAALPPELRHPLELLGDPAFVVAPVHYPRVETQGAEEGFKWFVQNEQDQRGQQLAPIRNGAGELPTLSKRFGERPPSARNPPGPAARPPRDRGERPQPPPSGGGNRPGSGLGTMAKQFEKLGLGSDKKR